MTATRRATVFACGRSNLAAASLSPGVRVVEVPCAGRISTPLLLATLLRGADGVLVLGRNQATCRFRGAEDVIRARVSRARELLELAGLDPARLAFREPAPGPAGPTDEVAAFIGELGTRQRLPLTARLPRALTRRGSGEGLDTAVGIACWLLTRPELDVDPGPWLDARALSGAAPTGPRLLAPELAILDILVGDRARPLRLSDAAGAAIATLGRLGYSGAGIAVNAAPGEPRPRRLDELIVARADDLPPPPKRAPVACFGRAGERVVRALGHDPVNLGRDPLPDRFAMSADHRAAAGDRLRAAARAGALALVVRTPAQLARWSLMTRHGTWQTALVPPLLGVQLAHLALTGGSLAAHEMEVA